MHCRQWMKSLLIGLVCLVALNVPTHAQTWIELFPAGGPTGTILNRAAMNFGYDAANNRLIVYFPANPGVSGLSSEIWVLTNANGLGGTPVWSKLTPGGMPPNNINIGSSTSYDAANNRLLVYGGCFANCSPAQASVYVLSNANGLGGPPLWSVSSVTNPQPRDFQSAVYDSAGNQMIAFGGGLAFFGTDQNDTRILSNANGLASPSTWTTLAPAGGLPGIREEHRAIYDDANNRMTIFGGANLTTTCCPYVINGYNDAWVLANANGQGGPPTWTQLAPGGSLPAPRYRHSAVYDSFNNRMLMFGGLRWDQATQTDTTLGDLWQLSHANGLGGTPVWTQLLQLGNAPGPNWGHAAAFDTAHQRMIVFGGGGGSTNYSATISHKRVWVLDFTPPSCTPPPSGMVSWWTGDGTANDLIGSNHGTLQNGATYAAGLVGQAFRFDGVDDYVQVGPQTSLANTGTITLDAWIFPTGPGSGPANGGVIISKESAYEIHRYADGTIRPAFLSAGWISMNTGFVAPLNQWSHIAVVDNNGVVSTYANGTLIHSFSNSGTGNINSAWNDFRIGGRQCSHCVEHFQGLIDEVEVFNRALSAAEIQAIFNAGPAGKCKNQAPVALCQNLTVAAGANCTAIASVNHGSYDPDGDAITITQSPAGPYPLGNTLVTLTVTDSKGASSQCTATVTVTDNTAPTITLNGANPMTVECHTGFSDPGATALDNCAGTVVVTTSGSVNPNMPGSYTLTYAATDGTNSTSATRTVNVVDTTAPVLTLRSPLTLWPPNHKYTTLTTAQIVQSVSDSCATLNLSQVVIEQVTSDEPDNGLGEGDTANDIVLASDCKSVQLRAERAGSGNGRVYSVRVRVQDSHANSTAQEFKVNVPLNQTSTPAVEDAPVITKTCGGGGSVVLPPGGTLKPAVTDDFDGDRKADFAVWREQQGAWLVPGSANNHLDQTLFALRVYTAQRFPVLFKP